MSAVQEGYSLRSSMGRCVFSGLWQTNINECKISCSVLSDFFRHYKLWPSRLLYPWDFPGKNTGVGYHFLLQRIFLTSMSCVSCIDRQTAPPGSPTSAIIPTAFANFLSLCPILVILAIYKNFHSYYMCYGICDQ